jgi:hypothetical protein
MSKTRTLLVALGLAALAVPAVALAKASSSGRSCCGDERPCCAKDAACCEDADATITCPMTGEKIKASECPLCKCRK